MIYVRINASFEGNRRGDIVPVDRTPRIEGLLRSKYLTEVDEDGTVRTRSVLDKKSVGGSRKGRAAGRRAAGDEPSEDPDSGGHGAAEGVDQVVTGDDGGEPVRED